MRIFGVDITFRINRASNANSNHNPHNLSHVERVDIKYKERDFTLQIIVALITLALFGISAYQAKVSRDAVEVAKATLDSSSIANRKNYELAKAQFDSGDIANKNNYLIAKGQFELSKKQFDSSIASSQKSDSVTNRNLQIAKQSADAATKQAEISEKTINEQHKAIDLAIQQLEENKRQFSSVNKPFLVIDKPVGTALEGEPLTATFNINNIGNLPARITYVMMHLYNTTRNGVTDEEVLKKEKQLFVGFNEETFKTNQYIIKGIALPVNLKSIPIDKRTKGDLEAGESFIVVSVEQHYINPYDNSKWAFRLIFKINKWKHPAFDNRVDILYNENEPLLATYLN